MIELFIEHRVDLYRIVSLLLGLAMWYWGSTPERTVALTFVLCFVVPIPALTFFVGSPPIFSNSRLIYAAFDVFAATSFILIALNANRNYILWVAGFQVIAVAAHIVKAIGDVVSPLAYAIMVIGPSYFQLILMLIGLIRHVRRKRKHGEYRDWRVGFSPPFAKKPIPDGLERQL